MVSHDGLNHATRLTEALAGDVMGDVIEGAWTPARRAAWELVHDQHPTPLPRQLLRVTEHTRWLQEQRHVADYDHVRRFSQRRAITAVEVARLTTESLQRHANEAPFRGFFALVALCAPRPTGV